MRPLPLLSIVLAAAGLSTPVTHAGGFKETVVQFRSIQDPAVPPDAAVCARAPFVSTVSLGASLYAFESRESDGTVEDESGHKLGTGTACVRITDPAFPPFSGLPYYSELTLKRVGSARNVRLAMNGVCTLTSNDVPVSGLVLAACSLQIAPASRVLGGVGSSNSIFNPLGLPGFSTGSYWTLRLFTKP